MKIIDDLLLASFRGAGNCEACGRFNTCREAAHILGRGQEGCRRIDHRWNLVSLGWGFGCACHARHHNGDHPTAEDLWAIVDKREKLTPGTAAAEIIRIRRL